MTKYRKNRTPTRVYRKIYESVHGPVPREENGRRYEIHHIDGDDSNNDIGNLVAVTLQEHYDIHLSQGDFMACRIMAGKLNKSPEEMSALISGENNYNFDPTVYNLVHKSGELFTGTRQDFFKSNITIKRCNFSLMIKGKANRVRGWKLEESVIEKRRTKGGGIIDSNIYNFSHKNGTLFKGNRRDFIKVHKTNQGKVSQLINGRISTTNGWRLI